VTRILLFACLLLACEGRDERPRRLKLPFEETTGNPTVTQTRRESPAPVTVESLVADGKHWRLTTPAGPVHVWVPKKYNPKRAETIIYVHGYYIYVDGAWSEHHLPEQFAAAGVNAMFIACEAPSGPTENVAWPQLADLLATVEKGIGQPTPRGRIVAMGHSGAFRTLLDWLPEKELDTVVLLDAAYGEVEKYRDWVLGDEKRRLIDVGDLSTREWTDQLHAALPDTMVLDHFPTLEEGLPRSASRARILYIKSTLGHFPLVTGGIAIPMILRALRAPRVLRKPLAELIEK
jgi:hypothetical protein